MKKLLLGIALILLAVPAFANIKISDMFDGGNIQPGDEIPIVRGGANYRAFFLNIPAGNVGDVQTNAGGGLLGNFSLNATNGLGSTTTGLLLNNNGVTQALSIGTVNGLTNTVTPIDTAAQALYQASQGLIVDPRMFGAICNTRYFDGRDGTGTVHLTAGSPVISITGYVFTTADIGKSIAVNGGAGVFNNPPAGDPGIPTTTIVSVDTINNTATMGASPTITTNSGYALLGNNDTAAFSSAANVAVAHGGYVIVPDSCSIRSLTLPRGTTLRGGAEVNGYTYGSTDSTPTMFIMATGYASDTSVYGINLNGAGEVGLTGFTIEAPTFPGVSVVGGNMTLACVGTRTGNEGSADAIKITGMTFKFCPVAVGHDYIDTTFARIFGQVLTTEFAHNGVGVNGTLSDWVSIDNVFTGSFVSGMRVLFEGSINRSVGDRFEENGIGIDCQNCGNAQLTHAEFQFNEGYAISLNASWGNWLCVNCAFEGSGGRQPNGATKSHIALNGNNTTSTSLHLINPFFNTANFGDGSGLTNYIFNGISSGTNNNRIEIIGGVVCNNGYSVAFANWQNGAPPVLKVDTLDCAELRTGLSDFSINSSGALGITTSSAKPGTILDMLNATTSNNSSIGFPGGPSTTRPGSPLAGMARYNSTFKVFEGYNGNQWAPLGSGSAPAGSISGFQLSNDPVTPNTILDIGAGAASSDDGTTVITLPQPITKTTAAWSLGSGVGCLDTGSIATSSWYDVFAIERTDSSVVDILCTLGSSPPVPLLPTNYNVQRLVGFFKTDGSANIIPFTQRGFTYLWTTPTLDVNTVLADTTSHLQTLNVPVGVSVRPIGSYSMLKDGGNGILWSSPDISDLAPTTSYPIAAVPGFSALDVSSTAGGVINSDLPYLLTNSSAQVRLRATTATTTVSEITNGYNVDLTQPVPLQPILVYNFMTGTLPSSLTFTRGSTAWYFNSSGLLVSAATNVPRFDYKDPGSSSLVGLLLESSRTNLVLWDRDLTQNSVWTATNVTPALDQTGIDGISLSASSITATATDGTICQSITTSAANAAFSVYLKRLTGAGTISISQDGGLTYSAAAATSSWSRFQHAVQSVTNPGVCIKISTSGDAVAVDVVQLEKTGSSNTTAGLTSPIITTSSSVTRSADFLSQSSIPWYNINAGALVFKFQPEGQEFGYGVGFGNPFSTNYNLHTNNGSWQAPKDGQSLGGAKNLNSNNNMGLSYVSPGGVFKEVLNGTLSSNTAALTGLPTGLFFGASQGGTGNLWVKSFSYWNYPLTSTQLQTVAP